MANFGLIGLAGARRKKNSDSKNWVTESVRAFELKIFVVRTGVQFTHGSLQITKVRCPPRKSDRVLTVLLPFSSHFRVKIPKNRLLLYRERDFWTGKFIKLYHEIVKSDSYYSKKLWNFNLSSISNKIRNSDFRKPLRKRTFGTFWKVSKC